MSARMIYAAGVVALLSACSQTTHTPPPSPAFVAATLGYEAYKDGDLSTAESQFRTALVEEPSNAYALLGLGAVRENQGDVTGAIDLYNAAQLQGQNVPTRYAYITEQRLERASNVEVAVLAQENLDRLYLKQASLTQGAQQGFVSYDGETAGFAPLDPIEPASYGTVESYADVPSAAPADGNYVAVGSYEGYFSTLGGAVVEPPVYSGDAAPLAYTDDLTYSQDVAPATYESTVTPAAYDDSAAPYYDAPLSYEGAQTEPDLSQYQSIGEYSAAGTTAPEVYAPTAAYSGGPVGPLLGYGEAFGGDTGAPAPQVNDFSDASGAVLDTGGLIYLSDG